MFDPDLASRRLRTNAGVFVLALVGLAIPSGAMAQNRPGPLAIRQIAALMSEKASRSPTQQKMESNLLLEVKRRLHQPLPANFPEMLSAVPVDPSGLTDVDIRADVSPRLLEFIRSLGGSIVNSHADFEMIRATLPVDRLEAIAARADVHFMAPAAQPFVHKINASAGDVAHRANLARQAFGVDGTGVRIGVISNGVATLANRQASGDLPASVTVLPGQAGSGDEGTAMLEIVTDLAPGAELYFATGNGSEAQMAQNILDLQGAGCDVIVDDLFYPGESTFQDDVIAQAVETATAAGVSYFSSAGNSGNKNDGTGGVWEGDFFPMAAPGGLPGTANAFGDGVSWNTVTQDSPYSFVLQWSDPRGTSTNDYDLYLLNSTMTQVLRFSTNVQNGAQDPHEEISSTEVDDTGNRLVIIAKPGAAVRFLHLNANRGRLSASTAGQIYGHAAAASAFGIAAVDVAQAGGAGGTFNGSESVESFSSDGPRRIFYLANGTPITPGNFSATGGTLRNKPDFSCADGVSTATPGFNPFFGTSAAAPHAAAIAALVIDRGASTTPSQVRNRFIVTCRDIEGPGWDRDSGHGILDAAAATEGDGPAPGPRFGHTAVRDRARNRMIVFGGWDGAPLNDLWALSLAGNAIWSSLDASGQPPNPRYQHSAIYDPVRDRMIVFGGSGGGFLDPIDAWSLPLAATGPWAHLSWTGPVPTERNWAVAVYDPPRDRMLMFGGSDNAGYFNDAWSMSLSGAPVWTDLAPTGDPPGPRLAPTAIYDPLRDRLVGFGGYNFGTYLGDVWTLSLSGTPTWGSLTPTGTPPSPRYGPAAIYDSARDRMVVFGGKSNGVDLGDMWALSLSGTPAWSNITPVGSGPGTRTKPAAVYDELRDRLVLFGGMRGSGFLNDTWTITFGGVQGWTSLGTPSLVDVPRPRHEDRRLELSSVARGARHEIRYSLPATAPTRLRILDTAGRLVASLAGDGSEGEHRVTWNHSDDRGHAAGPGIYFVYLQSGSRQACIKLILLR